MFNVYGSFFYSGIEMPLIWKEKMLRYKTENFELFLQLLKSEVIWTRISNIIRLREVIHFPETHRKS